MSKDDIIRMAREVGCFDAPLGSPLTDGLERFAALIAAAEREACARLCESYAMPDSTSETAVLLAAAIRARSSGMTDIWSSHAQKLIAAEREACAKIVESYCGAWSDEGYALAAAIRARGK